MHSPYSYAYSSSSFQSCITFCSFLHKRSVLLTHLDPDLQFTPSDQLRVRNSMVCSKSEPGLSQGALAKQQLEPGVLSLYPVSQIWRPSLCKPFRTAIDTDKDSLLQCQRTPLQQTTCAFLNRCAQELAVVIVPISGVTCCSQDADRHLYQGVDILQYQMFA